MYARAFDDIACAVETAKAVCGSGNTPRSWILHVSERTKDTNMSDIGILGQDFDKLKHSLRERFSWGSWKRKVSIFVESEVHTKEDLVILLDQLSYVNTGNDLIAGDTNRVGATQRKVSRTGPQHAATSIEIHSNILRAPKFELGNH